MPEGVVPEGVVLEGVVPQQTISLLTSGSGVMAFLASVRQARKVPRVRQWVGVHGGTTVLLVGGLVCLGGGALLGGLAAPVAVSLPGIHALKVDPTRPTTELATNAVNALPVPGNDSTSADRAARNIAGASSPHGTEATSGGTGPGVTSTGAPAGAAGRAPVTTSSKGGTTASPTTTNVSPAPSSGSGANSGGGAGTPQPSAGTSGGTSTSQSGTGAGSTTTPAGTGTSSTPAGPPSATNGLGTLVTGLLGGL